MSVKNRRTIVTESFETIFKKLMAKMVKKLKKEKK